MVLVKNDHLMHHYDAKASHFKSVCIIYTSEVIINGWVLKGY